MGKGIVLGKIKGRKTRVRYPSLIYGGTISHTFSSFKEAKESVLGLVPSQRRRAKFIKL